MYKKFLLIEALKEAREKRNSKVVKQNKTDVCRVCMATNVTMVGIFDCVNRNLAEDIEFCTGIIIKENDNLPKKICHPCLAKLKTAYIFKSKCLYTEKKFKSLSLNVKLEIKKEQSGYDSHDEVNPGDEIYDDDMLNATNDGHSELLNGGDDEDFFGDRSYNGNGPSNATVEANTSLEALLNPLHCDLCGTNFTTILEKRKHRAEHHKKEVEPKNKDKFICELCGKQLANKLTMRGHVKSHQPPDMFCAHCDYKTCNRSDLSKHLKLHTGEKRYQCKYCGRLFTVSSNLKIHVRRMHENDGLKKFGCTICDSKYTTKLSLKRHMDGHYNRRNFECEICHSRFNNRFSWRKHVKRVHNVNVPSVRGGRHKEHFVEQDVSLNWDQPSGL